MSTIPHLSVLQFQLEKNLGFGYCKLLDFTSLDPWYSLVIKIYQFKSDKPITDVQVLKDVPYLLNPLCIGWCPSLDDHYDWKIIGKLSRNDDGICPVFKIEEESTLNKYRSKFNPKSWCPVYNFSKKGTSCEYNQVAHLETLHLATSQNIINRATMEFLKLEGKSLEDFYYQEENLSVLEDYHRALQIPLYSKISSRYHNRVIPKTELPEIKHIPALALCLASTWVS